MGLLAKKSSSEKEDTKSSWQQFIMTVLYNEHQKILDKQIYTVKALLWETSFFDIKNRTFLRKKLREFKKLKQLP